MSAPDPNASPEIVTVDVPMLQKERDYWRESTMLAEEYVDKIATTKSLHEKVKTYNQYVLKRNKLEHRHVEVLQYMFNKVSEKKEGASSLPDER